MDCRVVVGRVDLSTGLLAYNSSQFYNAKTEALMSFGKTYDLNYAIVHPGVNMGSQNIVITKANVVHISMYDPCKKDALTWNDSPGNGDSAFISSAGKPEFYDRGNNIYELWCAWEGLRSWKALYKN